MWFFIVIVLLAGVKSFFKKDTAEEAFKIIEAYKEQDINRKKAEAEAPAFAESFISEMMTYEIKDYKDKKAHSESVNSYLGGNISSLFVVGEKTGSEVLESKTYGLEWKNDKELDILVSAKVKAFTTAEDGTLNKSQKTLYFRVPIATDGSKYIVEDYPLLVSKPEVAEVDYQKIVGETVQLAKRNELKEVIDSFLKVYASGTEKEIGYFTLTNSQIEGLKGMYEYQGIKNIDIYKAEEGYQAFATANLRDRDLDLTLTQGYSISIIIKESKPYIASLDARLGYIHENKEE